STLKVAATIQVGVPGTGGDIAADEGSVWVTIHDVPLSRIDVHTNTVTHQFVGPGGDGMRVLHGSIWLSNGRFNNVWRIQTAKVLDLVPESWTSKAQPVDLDKNGRPVPRSADDVSRRSPRRVGAGTHTEDDAQRQVSGDAVCRRWRSPRGQVH